MLALLKMATKPCMEVDTVVDADAGSGERVHESGTTTDTGELTHRGAV